MVLYRGCAMTCVDCTGVVLFCANQVAQPSVYGITVNIH